MTILIRERIKQIQVTNMHKKTLGNTILACILTCTVMFSAGVSANDYNNFIVFGDSLSDPGNAFALSGEQSVPPYETLNMFLVPSAAYAKGGHHLSNGTTWIEQLGQVLKVKRSTGPAWQVPGVFSNYAVGAARARNDGSNVNLTDQVMAFNTLADNTERLSESLVVIWIGGNDVRDATVTANPDIILEAITAIGDNIISLYQGGAQDFLIVNSPDIGLIPAIRAADVFFPGLAEGATLLSIGFNAGLGELLDKLEDPVTGLPGISFTRLNAFQILRDTVADPQSFGLENAVDACVTPGIPPFACKQPGNYLFWDGIHPTRAGHAIFAEAAYTVLAP
jgi:outer membrane lipase/esterase